MYTGCKDEVASGYDVAFPSGQVFDPAKGRNVSLPRPTIEPGKKLVAQACTVGGDQDHIKVFYVYGVSTPSSGLTPEHQEILLAAFDPFRAGGPVATVPWPADLADVQIDYIVPTYYGFMAGNHRTMVGFDPTTLQKTWRIDGPDSWNFEGLAAQDRSYKSPGLSNDTARHIFYSAKDGAEIGNYIGDVEEDVYPNAFIVSEPHVFPYVYRYFDMPSRRFLGPVTKSGAFWGNLRLDWNSYLGEHFIKVWDKDQNTFPFVRTGDEVTGLHIDGLSLAGKYLYIKNNTDSPVIDITTSQKVSSGWKVRPTEMINRDWALIVTGRVDIDQQQCYVDRKNQCASDDAGARKLVRSPNGQYPGPWF